MSLDVQPSAAAVVMGDTLEFVATLRSRSGDIVSVNRYTWTSSDTAAAAILSPGAVHTKREGNVMISAEALQRRGWSALRIFRSPVSSVSISPSTGNVYRGADFQLDAILRDQNGRVITDGDVAWGSSDFTIATVDRKGLVTGRTLGSVVITATSGSKTASATINVLSQPATALDLNIPADTALVGAEMQATATPRDSTGQPVPGRTIAWQSANPAMPVLRPA